MEQRVKERQVAVFLSSGRKRRRMYTYANNGHDRQPDRQPDSNEKEEEEKETKEEYKRGIQSSAKRRMEVKEGEREGGRNTLHAYAYVWRTQKQPKNV